MAIKVRVEKNIFRALANVLVPRSRAIVEDTKRDIVIMARSLVPVDTGTLRDNIKATPLSVMADTDYAGYVEYGTGYQRAQPYLTPAVERYRPVMIARLRDEDDLFSERGL